jgi:hypothetical protein
MHPIESRAVGSLSTCRPTRTMCQRLHVGNKPLSKPLVFSHEGRCNGKMDCFGVAMLLLFMRSDNGITDSPLRRQLRKNI